MISPISLVMNSSSFPYPHHPPSLLFPAFQLGRPYPSLSPARTAPGPRWAAAPARTLCHSAAPGQGGPLHLTFRDAVALAAVLGLLLLRVSENPVRPPPLRPHQRLALLCCVCPRPSPGTTSQAQTPQRDPARSELPPPSISRPRVENLDAVFRGKDSRSHTLQELRAQRAALGFNQS